MENNTTIIFRRPPRPGTNCPNHRLIWRQSGRIRVWMIKQNWSGCRPSCLVPTGEKPKRMETDHSKTGHEWKNVRLCSPMFAYVRLCSLNGEKNVEAPPARSAGFPACGFTELSSSVTSSAGINWGLESPQNPQTRMSAPRAKQANSKGRGPGTSPKRNTPAISP